ncbi:MAG: RDD family protein [Candidatus Methylacidiphilales bacterium]|nr:RDD family protein [Candidatus Methylacidiphilales bacterium]
MLQFYIRGEDGEEYGPVDLAELRDWALDNRIGRETVVRSAEPDSTWRPWGEFPELVAMLAEVEAMAVFARFPKLRVAPFGLRAAAWMVDYLVVVAVSLVLADVVGWLLPSEWGISSVSFWNHLTNGETGSRPQLLAIIAILVTSIAYNTYFLGSIGQTPGKGIFGMRVVNDKGEKIGYEQAFHRSIISIASRQLFMAGYILALITNHTRTLHDLLAGTYVVRCHNRAQATA